MKINIGEGEVQPSPTPAAEQLTALLKRAGDVAVVLAPVITATIEENPWQLEEALVAVLYYAANLARGGGASRQEFVNLAASTWGESEEVFATPLIEVLRAARAKLARGWCQGEMAMKWVKDASVPAGKRLVAAQPKEQYACRWSALGAIDACADAESVRKKARELLFAAVHDSGFKYKAGSLPNTVVSDWNDYGFAPPVPELKLPEPPEVPQDTSAGDAIWKAYNEARENYDATVAKMRETYEKVTVPQWPKPKADQRTKEQVLAVMDATIAAATT